MSRTLARPPARSVQLVVTLVALVACAGPLPYQPDRQPFGATISADVRVTEDRLRVEIDSQGYRVERAVLVQGDAAEIEPESLMPATSVPAGGGLSIGLGVGAGGSGSSGSYAVGTGIGLGGLRSSATTLVVFRLAEAGPPPWRLRMKVVGVVGPVDIALDPARRGRQ